MSSLAISNTAQHHCGWFSHEAPGTINDTTRLCAHVHREKKLTKLDLMGLRPIQSNLYCKKTADRTQLSNKVEKKRDARFLCSS